MTYVVNESCIKWRTGSSPLLKMIGIVLVAARAAGIEGLFAKITLT